MTPLPCLKTGFIKGVQIYRSMFRAQHAEKALQRLPESLSFSNACSGAYSYKIVSYGFAGQRNQVSPSQDDVGKPTCRSARAEFKSSGQRTLSRFRNGPRGARGNFIS